MSRYPESEVRAAYEAYVATRDAIERGERSWEDLGAEFFTDDAVFIDPAWGRVEGRDAIVAFMAESMAGLESWEFPLEWLTVDGDRLVTMWWNRLPGTHPDGRPLQAPGVSIMRYAGGGRFDYECDLLNMAEVYELMKASSWTPGPDLNVPPEHPNRDVSYPPGTEQ